MAAGICGVRYNYDLRRPAAITLQRPMRLVGAAVGSTSGGGAWERSDNVGRSEREKVGTCSYAVEDDKMVAAVGERRGTAAEVAAAAAVTVVMGVGTGCFISWLWFLSSTTLSS